MSNADIINLYSSGQRGGELPYFIGKQYGSGWLKSIARFAFPILRRLGGVAMKTASDVLEKDQKILPSLANNAIDAVSEVIPGMGSLFKSSPASSTSSSPYKRRAKSSSINKRRKTIFS
jgi:hypothetical protein